MAATLQRPSTNPVAGHTSDHATGHEARVEAALGRLFSSGATWVTASDVSALAGVDVTVGAVERVLGRLVEDRVLVTKLVPVYDTTVAAYRSRLDNHTCEMCACPPDSGGLTGLVRSVMSVPLAPLNTLRSWF